MRKKIAKMNKVRLPKRTKPYETYRQKRQRKMKALILKHCDKKHILVLDIDGTILNYRDHAAMKSKTIVIRRGQCVSRSRLLYTRPYFSELLEAASENFSIVLYTAGTESHLRHVMKRFGENKISLGFSNRWLHNNRKELDPFLDSGKNVTFVDDDGRHYQREDVESFIKVGRYGMRDGRDSTLDNVIAILRAQYPDDLPLTAKERAKSDERYQNKV